MRNPEFYGSMDKN